MPRPSTAPEIARQLRAYLPAFALPQLDRLMSLIEQPAAKCAPTTTLGPDMDFCALCGTWKRPGERCPHYTSGTP